MKEKIEISNNETLIVTNKRKVCITVQLREGKGNVVQLFAEIEKVSTEAKRREFLKENNIIDFDAYIMGKCDKNVFIVSRERSELYLMFNK